MKSIIALVVSIAAGLSLAATPQVKNVKATQRWPINGKVDISYEVVGDIASGLPAWNKPYLLVSVWDRARPWYYDDLVYEAAANALSGDTGYGAGKHHIVWDLDKQGISLNTQDAVFEVTYGTKKYCVIDLSAGPNATSYPVSYLMSASTVNVSEYKTNKLILRLIEPGTFKMVGKYDVAITKPFYIGVFEVTQRQWYLVTGTTPSTYKGDRLPVETVWENEIRRGDYGNGRISPDSFIGRLQARTKLSFDLPTEAQWEYACRAGTTADFNDGSSGSSDAMNRLGRYEGNNGMYEAWYNQGTFEGVIPTANVGSYQPNAWGLYDMHGNVWEICLDWYAELTKGGTDPTGPSSGAFRVSRGGYWGTFWSDCTSSSRRTANKKGGERDGMHGFRLSLTIQ